MASELTTNVTSNATSNATSNVTSNVSSTTDPQTTHTSTYLPVDVIAGAVGGIAGLALLILLIVLLIKLYRRRKRRSKRPIPVLPDPTTMRPYVPPETDVEQPASPELFTEPPELPTQLELDIDDGADDSSSSGSNYVNAEEYLPPPSTTRPVQPIKSFNGISDLKKTALIPKAVSEANIQKGQQSKPRDEMEQSLYFVMKPKATLEPTPPPPAHVGRIQGSGYVNQPDGEANPVGAEPHQSGGEANPVGAEPHQSGGEPAEDSGSESGELYFNIDPEFSEPQGHTMPKVTEAQSQRHNQIKHTKTQPGTKRRPKVKKPQPIDNTGPVDDTEEPQNYINVEDIVLKLPTSSSVRKEVNPPVKTVVNPKSVGSHSPHSDSVLDVSEDEQQEDYINMVKHEFHPSPEAKVSSAPTPPPSVTPSPPPSVTPSPPKTPPMGGTKILPLPVAKQTPPKVSPKPKANTKPNPSSESTQSVAGIKEEFDKNSNHIIKPAQNHNTSPAKSGKPPVALPANSKQKQMSPSDDDGLYENSAVVSKLAGSKLSPKSQNGKSSKTSKEGHLISELKSKFS